MDLDEKLIQACEDGNLEKVKFLIDEGADINARDNQGYSALFFASEIRNNEIIKLLKKSSEKE